MHLIVDIRAKAPEEMYFARYAEIWARDWLDSYPEDRVTFLAISGQWVPEHENIAYVHTGKFFPSKKSPIFLDPNETFGCISFSQFPLYYSNIPTIWHIFDCSYWIYDETINTNVVQKYQYKKFLQQQFRRATCIAVPHAFTKNELTEIFGIQEQKIMLFPYILPQISRGDERIFATFNISTTYIIYDSTYGEESDIFSLLRVFALYIHEVGGDIQLILHGNIGKNLRDIVSTLQELDIVKNVKIIGCLHMEEREALYRYASGWVAVGKYATEQSSIAWAIAYKLPLLLSDIQAFASYTDAIKVHPNHFLDQGVAMFHQLLEQPPKQYIAYKSTEQANREQCRALFLQS